MDFFRDVVMVAASSPIPTSGGPAFVDLTLDNYDVDEDTPPYELVATILGGLGEPYYFGLVAQSNTGWFFNEGDEFIGLGDLGVDFETNPSPTITIREYDGPASGYDPMAPVGPYHDTIITITVNDVAD